MKDYNEKDVKFVRDMIPHHESAKKMAADVYHNGKNEEIKKLAQEIYHAQDAEIKKMKKWLKDRGLPEISSAMKM